MSLRVAIPEPTSFDGAYNQRALPQYLAALHSVGLTPIPVPLHESQARVAKLLGSVQGILLPGSRADLEPERYGATRHALCGPADPARTAVDELLIQDAFNLHKPLLAICQGMQSLNVWLGGTLIQDLPSELGSAVNHAPGRDVVAAHMVDVEPGSRLAAMVPAEEPIPIQVNSSHHQAIDRAGDRLRVVARSPVDGVIEGVELQGGDHFVVGVQWHPERSFVVSALSRGVFRGFAQAVEVWKPREVLESVSETVV
jgi:putative glutamine amidotransferase